MTELRNSQFRMNIEMITFFILIIGYNLEWWEKIFLSSHPLLIFG